MSELSAAPVLPVVPPAARLDPLEAMRSIWTSPGPTVRRLLDHGDGGTWPWLLVAEFLAIPLAWVAGEVLRGQAGGGGMFLFLLLPALLAAYLIPVFVTLVGGVLLLGLVVDRTVRAKDLALALAWGLIPIPLAMPFTVLSVLALLGPGTVEFRMLSSTAIALSSLFVCAATLWPSVPAVLEAGRWSRNPWVALGLVAWLSVHGFVLAVFWFVAMMMWATVGLGLD